MDPVDAKRIQNAGVDAIWVSNHGGRQLDGSPPALLALPKIRESVGPNLPLIFDSGARSGEDIVKALALGANFCYAWTANYDGRCGIKRKRS